MNKTSSIAESASAHSAAEDCPVSGALDDCRQYVRQNPGMVLLGALIIGAVAGALCRRPEKKPTNRAWHWLDDTRHRISDEVERARKSQTCRQGQDLVRSLQSATRNFKFW